MNCKKSIAALAAGFPLALISLPAFAHHPLGGAPMTTFTHGLLSGFGHPILGFDHLFFIVIVGVAALFTGRALLAPGFFVAGMLAGVGLIMSGISLPFVEPMIAALPAVVGRNGNGRQVAFLADCCGSICRPRPVPRLGLW